MGLQREGRKGHSYLMPTPLEGNTAPAGACPEQAQIHWAHTKEEGYGLFTRTWAN